MSKSPSTSSVIMLLYKSLKVFCRQEVYYLTENVFTIVHIRSFDLAAKVAKSKLRTRFVL